MSVEINLLPWRDARRERHRRRWRSMLLSSLLIGVVTGYAVDCYYAARLEAQQRRLAMIERHIETLQPSVEAVERMRVRRGALEQRLTVLQSYLGRRAEVLALFNGLAATLEEGVRYSTLEQRDGLLVLEGEADNHQQLAAQLKALEASPVFGTPSLSVVEPLERGWRFRLSVLLSAYGGKAT